MTHHDLSEPVENFIKAVYILQVAIDDAGTSEEKSEQSDIPRVSTNALTSALGVKAPSVTDMAKRLADNGLIDYLRYRGVRLTAVGEALALNLIRRHRLIELYLVRELNYELHEVHSEAESLEHAVSDRFIEAIDAKLGNPQFDPHGDPIPDADGTFTTRELQPLSELPLTKLGRVSRFIATDSDMLQHTLDRGFSLHTNVEVIARDPFQGPITVKLNDTQTVIGFSVAETILVEVLEN